MKTGEIQAMENAHLAKVYSRRPIALVSGRGVMLYDADGSEYVDCAGGYGTCLVGHAHPKVVQAISEQASKLISCHGSTYNDARADFLVKLSGIVPSSLDRFYLSNSGSEAVECAIKLSRKATGKRKIVALKGGFHGKTHGALSATWDNKYRKSFEPLLADFVHIPFGDVEAAKSAINGDTAAVLAEPIQGEGGIRVAPPDWLPLLRDLIHDAGGLLIADEVQTGFGRTGRNFACDLFEVEPDILCLGKGAASGLPIGVTAAGDQVMGSFSVGEHTSTFGGNPVVCAAASATIDVLLEEKLVENAAIVGSYFKAKLREQQERLRIVRDVRGMGLMLGSEMRFDVLPILQESLRLGILLLDAGRNILRFLPPLSIQREHVDRVIHVLEQAMEKEQVARIPN